MKTIGLLGGMSWESTSEYYRIINQTVNRRLGGLHSAQCLMYSFDFAKIETLQHQGNWEALTLEMTKAARTMEGAGADVLMICTNTMHRMADQVQKAIKIPLLHIADATASAVKFKQITTVGLLGTRFTMEADFYRGKLEQVHGLSVLVPDQTGRETIHRVIYEELVKGEIIDSSREAYLDIITDLNQQGAQGVILGCTEIPMLIKQKDVSIPVFDTTRCHAEAAVDFALT